MAEYIPETGLFYTEARKVDAQWIYKPNHDRRDQSNSILISPDIYVVSAFGTRDALFDLQGAPVTAIMDRRRRLITPHRLVNRLSEHFGLDEKSYTPGQPIALLAEYTAAGGRNSYAQQLATEAHAPVYGLIGDFNDRQWALFFPDPVTQPVIQPNFDVSPRSTKEGQAVRARWTLLEKRESADLEVLSQDDSVKIDRFLAPQGAFVINAHSKELLSRGPQHVAASAREAGYSGDKAAMLLTLDSDEGTHKFAHDLAEALGGPVLIMTDDGWRADGNAIAKNTITVSRVEGAENRRISIDESGHVSFLDTQENREAMIWLNFGPLERSRSYFERKRGQMDDVRLHLFDVPKSALENIRQNAVRQADAQRDGNTKKPVMGDWLESPDQFGLRWDQAKELEELVVPGSTRTLGSLGGTPEDGKPAVMVHPMPDELGRSVTITTPTQPSEPAAWADASQTAIFIPRGNFPEALNSVPMMPWQPPTTSKGWHDVADQNSHFLEPPAHPGVRKAGTVIMEPDGRTWIIESTNHFAGARTFPKGSVEDGLSLQATAIKETYEETGLQVELISHLVDQTPKGSKTTTRYYLARRIGGTPVDMGWETQGVYLVPNDQVADTLRTKRDRAIFSHALQLPSQPSAGRPDLGELAAGHAERAHRADLHNNPGTVAERPSSSPTTTNSASGTGRTDHASTVSDVETESPRALPALPQRKGSMLEVEYENKGNFWAASIPNLDVFARVEIVGSSVDRASSSVCDSIFVTHLFRGALPAGSGTKLLVDLIQRSGFSPQRALVFKNVHEQHTLLAFTRNTDPAASLLGKLGAKTVRSIGLDAVDFKFVQRVLDGKQELDLVIGVSKSGSPVPGGRQSIATSEVQLREPNVAEGVVRPSDAQMELEARLSEARSLDEVSRQWAPAKSSNLTRLGNAPSPFVAPRIEGGGPEVVATSPAEPTIKPILPLRVPGRTLEPLHERVDPQFRNKMIDFVRSEGKITFADFMERSLYGIDGEGGYYNSGLARIGDTDDFFTAASLTRHFGGTIARALVDIHIEMGRPPRFDVVEMGAGNGDMAKAIIDKLAADHPEVYQALRYTIVERSEGLIPRQQAMMDGRPVQWVHASASQLPMQDVRGVFISNELVDAFPVHRVVKRGEHLRELYVTIDDEGQFVTTEGEASRALEAVHTDLSELTDLSSLPDGTELTVNARSVEWMKRIGSALDKGYVLTFDYGHPGAVMEAPYTFLENQKPVSLALRYPGAIDITAQVDFALLMQVGERAGLKPHALRGGAYFESQTQFLLKHGIREELARESDPQELAKGHRLLSEFHGFTVLVQRKDGPATEATASETERPSGDTSAGREQHDDTARGPAAAQRLDDGDELSPLLYYAGSNYIGLQHPTDTEIVIMAVLSDPSGELGHAPVTTSEVSVRGKVPSVNGGRLLAGLFERYDVRPRERLVFSSTKDEQTRRAYEGGEDPAMTALGRSGAEALLRLGLKPAGFRFERSSALDLDLVIDVAPQERSSGTHGTSIGGAYHPASDINARWVARDQVMPTAFSRAPLPEAPASFEIPRIMGDMAPGRPDTVRITPAADEGALSRDPDAHHYRDRRSSDGEAPTEKATSREPLSLRYRSVQALLDDRNIDHRMVIPLSHVETATRAVDRSGDPVSPARLLHKFDELGTAIREKRPFVVDVDRPNEAAKSFGQRLADLSGLTVLLPPAGHPGEWRILKASSVMAEGRVEADGRQVFVVDDYGIRRPFDPDRDFDRVRGVGGERTAFQARDKVVVVYRKTEPFAFDDFHVLNDPDYHLYTLRSIEEDGGVVVKSSGIVDIWDTPSFVLDAHAAMDKDIIGFNKETRSTEVTDDSLLSHRSVESLERHRAWMIGTNCRVMDLQFLIAENGQFIIADPGGYKRNTPPDPHHLEMIDLYIAAARKKTEADEAPGFVADRRA
ncbi:SAM-dependent methyltransferase [Sinorhizobium sp. BJ1]|uniref:SAM-dependent methyltransferase n=1 Tax=Sinorhizobium sp. BJ1 TaxID=2035455 RepID=UPI000BE7D977|nr:SAM-dependent methyltransferase [Sinorhizobium sp. BJ1]PDT77473.1 hypothetical protein CO676_33295 [Sinorhizobium sp. BJ1]